MVAITERKNNKSVDIDIADGYQIAQIMNTEDKKVAKSVSRILPQIGEAIEKIADSLKKGGRMAYFGCGTSGRIGVLDSSEIPPTFGASPNVVQGFIAGGNKAIRCAVENAEDSPELALEDVKRFSPHKNDVVVGISATGNATYVQKVMEYAQTKGAFVIAITSNPHAKINAFANIILYTAVGAEVISGSSRLKSGTAQKMVLNMLSTGAMIRLGKVYQNYMVDLEQTNAKLHDRALRFVMEITDSSRDVAQKTLTEAQNVKIACVMIMCQCSKEKAVSLLQQHGGILRAVLTDKKAV